MDNRDVSTAFGEWLCSLTSSPYEKSAIHAGMSSMYQRDHVIVSNLCNGYGYISEIPMTIIDGAKEWYKQVNKALLEISILSDREKLIISAGIDNNAELEKQRWISSLLNKGIIIKY